MCDTKDRSYCHQCFICGERLTFSFILLVDDNVVPTSGICGMTLFSQLPSTWETAAWQGHFVLPALIPYSLSYLCCAAGLTHSDIEKWCGWSQVKETSTWLADGSTIIVYVQDMQGLDVNSDRNVALTNSPLLLIRLPPRFVCRGSDVTQPISATP